jgi:hypothetical protein
MEVLVVTTKIITKERENTMRKKLPEIRNFPSTVVSTTSVEYWDEVTKETE